MHYIIILSFFYHYAYLRSPRSRRNSSYMITRTQRDLRTRDNDGDKKVKRQRRNIAGRWVVNKGNDLVNNDDDMGGNNGSKGDRKGAKK